VPRKNKTTTAIVYENVTNVPEVTKNTVTDTVINPDVKLSPTTNKKSTAMPKKNVKDNESTTPNIDTVTATLEITSDDTPIVEDTPIIDTPDLLVENVLTENQQNMGNVITTTTPSKKHSGILQTLQAFIVDPKEVQTIEGINPRHNLDLEPLKEFIKINGTNNLPPIKVYRKTVNGNDTLFLTEGHRRLTAVKQLQDEGFAIKGLPAMWSDKKDTSNDRLLFANLTSNQGKELEPLEIAEGIALLVKYGWKQSDIAKNMGKTAPWVTQMLSLLEATPEVRQKLEEGVIKPTTVQHIVTASRKVGEGDKTIQEKAQKEELAKELEKKALSNATRGTNRRGKTRGRPKGSASTVNTGMTKVGTSKPSVQPSTNGSANGTVTNGATTTQVKSEYANEKDPSIRTLLQAMEKQIEKIRATMGLDMLLLVMINFEKVNKHGDPIYVDDLRACHNRICELNKNKK